MSIPVIYQIKSSKITSTYSIDSFFDFLIGKPGSYPLEFINPPSGYIKLSPLSFPVSEINYLKTQERLLPAPHFESSQVTKSTVQVNFSEESDVVLQTFEPISQTVVMGEQNINSVPVRMVPKQEISFSYFISSIEPSKERINNISFDNCDGKKCGQGKRVGVGHYVCPHNNLELRYPELCKEWHPTLNNFPPSSYLPGSGQIVWWICKKGLCDCHVWQAPINHRTSHKTGCPYCVSRKICFHNSLAGRFPELAEEWDSKENKMKSDEISSGSHENVSWICRKNPCGCHKWQESPHGRTHGRGCPYCSRRKLCDHNNFAHDHPNLAKEWNIKRNTHKPSDFSPGSDEKVWWCCEKGHEWQAKICSRTYRKVKYGIDSSCPVCAKVGYSQLQIMWLNSIMEKEKNFIQNILSPGGEHVIVDIGRVDGYCPSTNTVYEFHGDYWHGNPDKYDPDDEHPIISQTFGELYQKTVTRDNKIRELGYNLVVKWEKEFMTELAEEIKASK